MEEETVKPCRRCGGLDFITLPGGKRRCRPCTNKYSRVYQADHPVTRKPGYFVERNLRLRYGLTPENYQAMLALQGGVCGICEKPPTNRKLVVDHDHRDNTVRGLLCAGCNGSLGKFENADWTQRAREYLGVAS